MRALRQAIPQMFHRRLLLLLALMSCATFLLGGQLFRLTVRQGSEWREEAEKSLVHRRLVPTVRGRIFDRKDRVLAEDRPCYDITLDYDLITGERAYRRARRDAYRDYRSQWLQWSFDQREEVITEYRAPYDAQRRRILEALAENSGLAAETIEQRMDRIVRRVQTIRVQVWDLQARRRELELGEPVELSDVSGIEIAEEREAHTVLAAVPDEVAHRFRKLERELDGLHVVLSKTRDYPYRQVDVEIDRSRFPGNLSEHEPLRLRVAPLSHLMGRLRDVWREDVDESEGGRPFRRSDGQVDLGGYLPGDEIGLGGIEQAEESRLRGARGQLLTRKDRSEQDESRVERRAPEPGKDVHLTLDVALQSQIQGLMDPASGIMQVQPWHLNGRLGIGEPLFGAAVVLEVDSGEVLAMVSTPAPPADLEEMSSSEYQKLIENPFGPLINKPLTQIYPPGSTLKPFTYALAVRGGLIHPHQLIECKGHLLEDRNDVYRCWTYRPNLGKFGFHGSLRPSEALARSCNIYFYQLGRMMGAAPLVQGLHDWGFGRPTGLGLPGDAAGLMPSVEGFNPEGRELSTSNAILMGIGQGPLAVTPLQVASAHAALARGGYYLSPLLIRERANLQQGYDLKLPPRVIDEALHGMEEVITASYGTAHHLYIGDIREPIIDVPGVVVRAKTGTAQAPRLLDEQGNVIRSGDHSWFVCHVQEKGRERASYVIAVVVEYGGSGGRVSGPITHQIIRLLRKSGYLKPADEEPKRKSI